MTVSPLTLTDDERDLLRARPHLLGFTVAHPAGGISHLRTSHAGGCGGAFRYDVAAGKLTGSWVGSPGRPHRTVVMSLTHIQRWAESLPDELRQRARVAWATHPVWTRDLAQLDRIVLEAIDLDVPAQLDLFEATS